MIVRIRFTSGSATAEKRLRHSRIASLIAALLEPVVVAGLAMGLWRMAAGFGWVAGFAIDAGFFSYWQTWISLAACLQVCASALNGYGKRAALRARAEAEAGRARAERAAAGRW